MSAARDLLLSARTALLIAHGYSSRHLAAGAKGATLMRASLPAFWIGLCLLTPLALADGEELFGQGLEAYEGGDHTAAVAAWQGAVAAGSVAALHSLAGCYERGEGVEADAAEALRHFRQAAEKGLPVAMYDLGLRLIDEAPRPGAHGTRIAFVHPKATGGALTELVEDPNASTGPEGRCKAE